jgi:hypothetical protein
MLKRRWMIVPLSAACAGLGVAAWLLLCPAPPSSRITPAAAGRIERGMTAAEAEAVIGLPPGDYRSDPPGPGHFAEFLPKLGVRVLEWEAGACTIQVRVDENSGRVLSKLVGESLGPSPPSKRLRAWLRL